MANQTPPFNPDGTHPNEGREVFLLREAVAYYITGRFATLCFYVPLAGVLWHHALEFFLKSELLKANPHIPAAEVGPFLRAYGHGLDQMWKDFRAIYSSAKLARFDNTVGRLNKFEEIRYPVFKGMVKAEVHYDNVAEAGRPQQVLGAADGFERNTILAIISLEEMDHLFSKLWEACGLTPKHFDGTGYHDSQIIQSVYGAHNKHLVYVPEHPPIAQGDLSKFFAAAIMHLEGHPEQ